MVKSNKHRTGAGAGFVFAVGQSVVAIPGFAQSSAQRCAAGVRYLLLAVICHAAPILIELSMDPGASLISCGSQIFGRCFAALVRLLAASKPIAGIAKPPDVRARRLAHP